MVFKYNSKLPVWLRILRSLAISSVALGVAWLLCSVLQKIATTDVYVPLIFVLAVMIISLTTDGYIYGILASLVSVLGVNWAFTYPYRSFNFTIYGYPTTFITMLAVSMVISTLISRLREQEKLRRETEHEKLRGNLLRAISHDLRTPLTGIICSISSVLDEGDSLTGEQRIALLTDAKDDAEWLVRMVENLLSITRISDGENTRINKSPEALEEIIGECANKFKKRNPDVRLEVSIPGEFILVDVDAILIEQVIMNFMDNSVHHGLNTNWVKISAEKKKGFVHVSVEDDGGGVDPTLIDNLFLGEAQPTDSSRYRGIGLAVCKSIIDVHGGSISARNTSDGAEFDFSIPVEETEDAKETGNED